MVGGFAGEQILEDVDNPFLGDFYKKKAGSAFQTQLFFLLSRYQQQREIAQIDLFSNLVIADYHFPKDKIFACLNLDDSELMIYDRLYTLLAESLPKPDLVIYLQGSLETCMKRVKKAARSFDKGKELRYGVVAGDFSSHRSPPRLLQRCGKDRDDDGLRCADGRPSGRSGAGCSARGRLARDDRLRGGQYPLGDDGNDASSREGG